MDDFRLGIARTFLDRLQQRLTVLDCKVFGSSARGTASEDSDLDLFVAVEKVTAEVREAVYDVAFELGFEHGLVLAPLLFAREELEEGSPLRASPILLQIEREGFAL